MILKYTATRANEEAIIALLPASMRNEVTDALRADAWLGVFIRPELQRTYRDYHGADR